MLHTKYQDSMPYGFREEDFYIFISKIYFSPFDLDVQRAETFRAIDNEGYIRTIHVMFSQNPASSLWVDVLLSNC